MLEEKKTKVLLVDDVRELVYIKDPDSASYPEDRAYYADGNYDFDICRTAEGGIEALTREQFDVLLLDHDMGLGMTGMGVIRFLEENPQHMPQKIYLVTANIVMGPLMMEYLQRWFKEGKILRYEWLLNSF